MGSNIKICVMCLITYFCLKQSHSAVVGTRPHNLFDDDDGLTVQLANPVGKIHGHTLQSQNGNDFYAFQDIPYAQPPTGENRFQLPKPLEPWEGVLETTSNNKVCPQMPQQQKTDNGWLETEDCLVLNIYSPVKPGSNASLPVFFWIHGGSFNTAYGGISMFDPRFLIDYEVIIVTINYRLGVLGFLTTDDEFLPGNLGLKDQHLALKWTHDNIHLFGGDPQQITVGGESAGAMSVGAQLLSPLNKGLFQAVIESSGSGIGTVTYQSNFRELAFKLGNLLDTSFNSTESGDLLELLQSVSQADIIKAQAQFLTGGQLSMIWKPIIEDRANKDAIVTGHMHNDFISGNFNKVPIFIGFNSEEALMFLNEISDDQYIALAKSYDDDERLLISEQLNVAEGNRKIAGREMKALYTSDSFVNDKAAFVRYNSDELFVRSTIRQAEAASQYVPVYLYQLSWDDQPGEIPGVAHGSDLAYLWNFPMPNVTVDERLRKPMLKLWTNFIKTQNPTPETDEELQNIIWPTVQPTAVRYFNLNQTMEILENPRQYSKMKEVLDKYIQAPYNVY